MKPVLLDKQGSPIPKPPVIGDDHPLWLLVMLFPFVAAIGAYFSVADNVPKE